MSMSLKQWLYRENYNLKGDNKQLTHTFMDGGTLVVPEDDINKSQLFYDMMAKHIIKQEFFPISELRTEVFHYYLDFDIKSNVEVSKEDFIIVMRNIQKVLSLVLKCDNEHYCYISTCNSKILEDNKIKTGFHVNYPMVNVDSFIARKLRQIIIQYLNYNKQNIIDLDWEQVIDEEVYVGAGLRMIGADKAKKCPIKNCAGKKKNGKEYCDTCDNKGYIYENRRYFPYMIMKSDGSEYTSKMEKCRIENLDFLKDKNLFSFIIKKNSIRTHNPVNVVWQDNLPAWYNPFPITERIIKKKSSTKKYLEDKILTEEKEMKIKGSCDLERIDSYDSRFIEVQRFIQNMWNVYNDLRITVFKKVGKKGCKHYSYCVLTYNHYCHNISREHQSHHIWFHIDSQTHAIYQRCFDCKDYISKNVLKLSEKMIKILFPEYYDKAVNQSKIISKSSIKNKSNDFESLFEIDDL